MVTITTAAKSVTIETPDFTWNIVKLRIMGQTPIPYGTRLVTEMGEFALRFDDVTGNGSTFASAEDLQDWVTVNCFSLGGGSGNWVESRQEGGVGTVITNFIALTQAEYDGLAVKNPSTAYDIIES